MQNTSVSHHRDQHRASQVSLRIRSIINSGINLLPLFVKQGNSAMLSTMSQSLWLSISRPTSQARPGLLPREGRKCSLINTFQLLKLRWFFQIYSQDFLSRALFPCNMSIANSVPGYTRVAAQHTSLSVCAFTIAISPGYLDIQKLAVTNLKTYPDILQKCLKVFFISWVLGSTFTCQLSW